jgi:hypothetical protein
LTIVPPSKWIEAPDRIYATARYTQHLELYRVSPNGSADEASWDVSNPQTSPWSAPTALPLHRAPAAIGMVSTSGGSLQWTLHGTDAAASPTADRTFAYGPAGAIPVVGDWTGTGVSTIGVYWPPTNPNGAGHWALKSTNSAGMPDIEIDYGGVGDVPVVGDWTGSGKTTIGVYRPAATGTDAAKWLLRNSNNGGPPDIVVPYGGLGDKPVVGNWSGIGTMTTIGVFRPASSSNGAAQWLLRKSNTPGAPDIQFAYGGQGDVPVVGDWSGTGTTTIGVVRRVGGLFRVAPAWLLRNSNSAGDPDIHFNYGDDGAVPVVGVWGPLQ